MRKSSLHVMPPPPPTDRWLSPDRSLLGDGRRLPPEFPLRLMGEFWANWITGAAEAASAPVDYIATALLTSASAVIANARWPLAGAGWKEAPILLSALVGSPSSGKSPALEAVLDLVRHAEAQMNEGFERKLRDFEMELAAAKAKHETWEQAVKAAIKAGELPPPLPDDAVCPAEPVRPRIRVADCTTEKLGILAASHDRGLLLVRDELSGWLGSFDKYGGNGGDRAFALEMYGGRSYVIDRMKSGQPINIPRLSVCAVGGVQPDKVVPLITGPDDGLISRFLWCWPGENAEFQLCRKAPDHTAAKQYFVRLLELRLATDEFGQPAPIIIRLLPEAENLLEEFARQMKRTGADACGPFAGAVGKARGHVLRLATVIEYLWWCASPEAPEPESISEKAVLAAAALMEHYFLSMAERVFGDASIPLIERNAITIIKHLRKNRADQFNARDLRRELGGALREPKAMDAACGVLEEAGLIRQLRKSSGIRQRKDFQINPVVYEGNT